MIVGTAGHIDHGKTALLQALTGQQGDKRPAERERGITIDLGYIYADLGDGQLTGFIDVPGHERFVHNMLAGSSGIDLLLLVVAADDGVMPQTREHLAIAQLLGTRRALVALTKIDRVDSQQAIQAQQQITQLLSTGPLADSAIYPVSSITGDGIAELREALKNSADHVQQRSISGYFRLPIDRAFSVSGSGIVVTGTAKAGQVSVGDELTLSPSGRSVRVRGMHAQNQQADHAIAGQRVALNITGERLALEHVRRGDWLLTPALHAPTTRIDIQLEILPGESRDFSHWTPVHVHLAAQDVTGRVALLEGTHVEPGKTALAQILLNAPVHAVHNDRLVLRDQSAQRTVAGGRVLDPFAPARNRRSETRLAQLNSMRVDELEAALPTLLHSADNGLDPTLIERQFNQPRALWTLPGDVLEITTRIGTRLFSRSVWQQLSEQLLDGLQRFHTDCPDELGPDRDRLRRYALPALERPVFISLLEQQLASGSVANSGPWLHLPAHQVQLSETDEALREQLWPLLLAGNFDPPWVRDLASTLQQPEADVRLLLRKLARLGMLHQVVKDLFYPEQSIRQLAAIAVTIEQQNGSIKPAIWRDSLNIGRKRSIQLLEYFDRIGFTRRLVGERKIRADSALAEIK
ncbi:selenocysteine-specific translation elongation factor [Pseudomonas sp. M30-35]|uniref:selenocysteine-specific translation elongation factor n=1 Tax=Pseudomonas sp. M30-35 TaxID=1981174 RepID=UPI000B3C25E1|nr:selenocysteine-specific translation elongation factor [Pseudomonas sp. M30-35]ARU89895.1 selenocysteine-specific translation elongation factor [Pseudomonas sp. M30-35]